MQISALEDEREQLQARVEKLEKQAVTLNDQNKTLKRDNEDMRQQLGIEVRTASQVALGFIQGLEGSCC